MVQLQSPALIKMNHAGFLMRQKKFQCLTILIAILVLSAITGCQVTPVTDANPEEAPSATLTLSPTITFTTTPAFTITMRPTQTPTVTNTPYRTLSVTPSPSPIPERPSLLFAYEDNFGNPVDWSYHYVTEIGYDQLDTRVNHLSAWMAFQLLDRGIHQRNFYFLGEPITVYYLNVAHTFDGQQQIMQLVLGGTPGENVPIQHIPAGGTAYLQVHFRDSLETFSPQVIFREANAAYEVRDEAYPLIFIKDLQAILPTLLDEVILLANHPVLVPQGSWPRKKLDMQRVSYLAARYQPFFELDAHDRIIDQSEFAYHLQDYLLEGKSIPVGIYAFSSHNLVIVQPGP